MKQIKKTLRFPFFLVAGCLVGLFASCTPDDQEPEPKPQASFTVSPMEDMENTFLLSTTVEAQMYHWDIADGAGFVEGGKTATAFFETKGEYIVKLKVSDAGGESTAEQTIMVEQDIQSGGLDLISGGDMSSDEFWTINGTGGNATITEFTEDGLIFTNEGEAAQTNVLVWQTVEVEAAKDYKFSANVAGSGAQNSWFEVYLSNEQPVEGADYSTGGIIGLSTWDGCATSAFSGSLISIGCWNGGSEKGGDGIVQFEESGTIYVVLKSGSWDGNLGEEGITLSDVKLLEVE